MNAPVTSAGELSYDYWAIHPQLCFGMNYLVTYPHDSGMLSHLELLGLAYRHPFVRLVRSLWISL